MSSSRKMKIIISIVCISFIQGLQFSMSPVLAQIAEHFPNVNPGLIPYLVTGPSLIGMVIALISGVLVVKITKKQLLVFAGFIAGATGFLPLVAPDNFGLLFACRIVYGVALGLATCLNTAVVAEFFEGDERASVMGIQGASVGAGMAIITFLGGQLGKMGYTWAYFTHIIGFICMILLALLLPETGTVKVTQTEKIRLNANVFKVAILGAVEWIFLMSFNTSISNHVGDPATAGTLLSVFSGSQIVMGLILGYIAKVTKKLTMPVAMLSFAIGAVLLVLFRDNVAMMTVAAVFCGFSQGMFIPTGMVAVSNAVRPVATAMASACFTCFMCGGQLVSPAVLSAISKVVYGDDLTTHIYTICIFGMVIAAALASVIMLTMKNEFDA